jgi:DNA-directed RNA polymerase specialized sigma24 family protein
VAGGTSFKKDWELSQDAFDTLLARLDPDRERAAALYEHIRRALITFFECRGSRTADEHADTTINRAARRLIEGTEIHTGNPASYFYGVAKNVLRESWDAAARGTSQLDTEAAEQIAIDPHRLHDELAARRLRERRLECLERCLSGLSGDHQSLINEYYQGETRLKIANRKRLADRLGIPINALRIRVLRLRERLEGCVARCLERQAE